MPTRSTSKIAGMSTTRHSVLDELQKGLNDGWRRFIDIYAPTVHRFSRSAGLKNADADEVLSTILKNLLTFFRNGGAIDPQKGRFRVYFRDVINNAIKLQKRKLMRIRPGGDIADEPRESDRGQIDELARIERQERMRSELDRLFREGPVRARDLIVFECYAIERESVEDVAKWFNLSQGRVYAIKHEIIKMLRERIEAADRAWGED